MVVSFHDKLTATLFRGLQPKKGFPANVARTAYRKLLMLDAAILLEDLRSPYGNRLEALKDDRAGQHSIRINDQWRMCFIWRDGNSTHVEVTDYNQSRGDNDDAIAR